MQQLERQYTGRDVAPQEFREWYFGFATIPPSRDGKGRVASITLAARSFPAWNKFLAPGQCEEPTP